MVSKSQILKAIFKLQTEFNKQDKQQIERIIFNQPSEEEWNLFLEVYQNIQSLYLNNVQLKKQLNITNFSSLKQLFLICSVEIPIYLQLELKNLKNLCELNLKFEDNVIIEHDFFKILFVENLQCLANFNKLSIYLNQCLIARQNASDLAYYITVLKNLKHLLICYRRRCPYDDTFLQKIWVGISQLDILESFHLDLNNQTQKNEEEFDFQLVLKGKPICNSLKHLRLLMMGTIFGQDQIKLISSLKEFKKLETFIFQKEIQSFVKEIDEQLMGILNNNKDTLKTIDLWFFIIQQMSSEENLEVQNVVPSFQFFDQIKYLQKLEILKMFINMITEIQQIKTLTQNARECKQLMQFYLEFSLKSFEDFDQSEFKQIYNDLMTLPYLTHCFADINENNYLAKSFKKTSIDVFDVESEITNYFDPFTISKGYKKYQKLIEENKISNERLLTIFKQNLLNNRISQNEFIIPNSPPKNQNTYYDEIINESMKNVDEDYESEYSFSFASEENFELFKYSELLSNFFNQKNSEIYKIHIFKEIISLPIKVILGDLSLIKYLYWDLYI